MSETRAIKTVPDEVSENCTECGVCVEQCAFLQRYGTPKSLADRCRLQDGISRRIPFECSLCGLCAAVCPSDVDPAVMFLALRRELFDAGAGEHPEHAVILNYEKRGLSKRFTCTLLPEGCDTIFFPGCALPGTRPETTRKLFHHLQKTVQNLGVVLDCCAKPSHDLGRQDRFLAAFGELKTRLLEHGVRTVLTACPNCYKVFNEYGGDLHVKTVYEALLESPLPELPDVPGTATVHDPCGIRHAPAVQDAVRTLAAGKNITLEEMPHCRERALCCGEGGSAGFLSPELAVEWREKKKQEASGRTMLVSCAGCGNALGKETKTLHILDVLFRPEEAARGEATPARTPWTWMNRLRLKRYFKKTVRAAHSGERPPLPGDEGPKNGLWKKLLLLAAVVCAVLAVRATGASRFLDATVLRELIGQYGAAAPLLFIAVYAVAPSLFLPGLPLTLAGGILFGPVWGVVYSITGATIGACGAFLVSRYIARDWVAGKLRTPGWKKLDEEVRRHGWKIVVVMRLMPIFPFNLLNYAFGLTDIKFLHYAPATFFGMLPACIAFVFFSSSLLDLFHGRISGSLLVGVFLIGIVSVAPLLYRKFRKR